MVFTVLRCSNLKRRFHALDKHEADLTHISRGEARREAKTPFIHRHRHQQPPPTPPQTKQTVPKADKSSSYAIHPSILATHVTNLAPRSHAPALAGMPPAYFYHLKFDLEEAPAPNSNSNKSNPFSHEEAEAEAEETKKQQGAIAWLPPPGTDIFDRSGAWTAAGHRDNRDRDRKRGESGVGVQGGDIREREGERKEGTTLPLASRDWRFGRVRIEAVDMPPPGAPPASGMGMVPQPSASAASGRVTKAEFRPIRTGTTDVGWGVVRLYRDGEESPWLASGAREGLPAGKEEGEGDEKDCTTLCIPAVPSYLTPSDFLGFVGEKTRTLVSHFRMVMTGRMNRYLVLMKFRDGKDARKWRREWDGTVFNSMEVSLIHPCYFLFKGICDLIS